MELWIVLGGLAVVIGIVGIVVLLTGRKKTR
jgi:uncharacterized membrane protein YbaN (DUF454 family)